MGTMSPAETDVVILHGLGRTRRAMQPVAGRLWLKGYRVHNVGYPSRRHDVPTLARKYLKPVVDGFSEGRSICFVTHSLGGILVRYFCLALATEEQRQRIARVVMLAPPNHGSVVVDKLKRWPVYASVLGPAFRQLGTDGRSLPLAMLASESQQSLGYELGVIAGTESYEPWFSQWLEADNDGKVSAGSAAHPQQVDMIKVRANHTTIMRQPEVLGQITYFLEQGCFSRQSD